MFLAHSRLQALQRNATVGAEQKIEDFVIQDLRHCAVTNLANAGAV